MLPRRAHSQRYTLPAVPEPSGPTWVLNAAMDSTASVLLINPTIVGRRSARFPLALLSLASGLDGKYATQIIDGNIDRQMATVVRRTLQERRFVAVGITVMGGPQLGTAIAVSKLIRELAPGLPIIWGGYFPTLCPVQSIVEPYVDYVVRGQGEATFLELL